LNWVLNIRVQGEEGNKHFISKTVGKKFEFKRDQKKKHTHVSKKDLAPQDYVKLIFWQGEQTIGNWGAGILRRFVTLKTVLP